MTKACAKCKNIRPIESFCLRKQKKTGNTYPHSWCKECLSAIRQEYNSRKAVKIQKRNWVLNNKDKVSLSQLNYIKSNKSLKYRKETYSRVVGNGQLYAATAVYRAIRNGILYRKNVCVTCFKEGVKTHFHHYLGYTKKHRLDVVELCPPCHKEAHLEVDHPYHPKVM